MSRKVRDLRKRFIVFCEGDTEYNYVDHMRLNQGVELALKPINMGGGGYASFLDAIKSEASNNCLAKFVIIDFDRVLKHPGEKPKFIDIINYCKLQNEHGKIPHFVIVDNPDFEYVSCLHIEGYNGQNVKQYIEKTLGFIDLDKFKAKEDIYEYLNSNNNSYNLMLERLNKKLVTNTYTIDKTNMDIQVSDTQVDWDNERQRGSNINEFFDVIDW